MENKQEQLSNEKDFRRGGSVRVLTPEGARRYGLPKRYIGTPYPHNVNLDELEESEEYEEFATPQTFQNPIYDTYASSSEGPNSSTVAKRICHDSGSRYSDFSFGIQPSSQQPTPQFANQDPRKQNAKIFNASSANKENKSVPLVMVEASPHPQGVKKLETNCVLATVPASPKQKKELGVDYIVTEVRRSPRLRRKSQQDLMEQGQIVMYHSNQYIAHPTNTSKQEPADYQNSSDQQRIVQSSNQETAENQQQATNVDQEFLSAITQKKLNFDDVAYEDCENEMEQVENLSQEGDMDVEVEAAIQANDVQYQQPDQNVRPEDAPQLGVNNFGTYHDKGVVLNDSQYQYQQQQQEQAGMKDISSNVTDIYHNNGEHDENQFLRKAGGENVSFDVFNNYQDKGDSQNELQQQQQQQPSVTDAAIFNIKSIQAQNISSDNLVKQRPKCAGKPRWRL